MHRFDYESITFKAGVNMFKHMEIEESIYEGVLEPYHKKPTGSDTNRDVHSSKIRGEENLSNTYSEMIE